MSRKVKMTSLISSFSCFDIKVVNFDLTEMLSVFSVKKIMSLHLFEISRSGLIA
jgi:hypothetical protein